LAIHDCFVVKFATTVEHLIIVISTRQSSAVAVRWIFRPYTSLAAMQLIIE
jgi:hypothetical protein